MTLDDALSAAAAPFVEAEAATQDGALRLHSSPHEESLWLGSAARVSPDQARGLARILTVYADTHSALGAR